MRCCSVQMRNAQLLQGVGCAGVCRAAPGPGGGPQGSPPWEAALGVLCSVLSRFTTYCICLSTLGLGRVKGRGRAGWAGAWRRTSQQCSVSAARLLLVGHAGPAAAPMRTVAGMQGMGVMVQS